MAITSAVHRRKSVVVEAKPALAEADAFDVSLRPKTLREYVGQIKVKQHLAVHLEAAKMRKEPLGHALLHGPPGLGKTTLAHILAVEMRAKLRMTSGPAIEKPGDLASLLTNVGEGDVLFIDEIHRLRPVIEEVLYAAMEDYALDIMIGKGPSARSMRIPLKPFTLIGATTKVGSMSAPLRDRFLHTYKLGFYEVDELMTIVKRSAAILKIAIEEEAASLIARSSRATPRIANRLLRFVRDFSSVAKEHRITLGRTTTTLASLEVDSSGLDAVDRSILRAIIEKFGGGPVGLSTIAAATAEEEETIEDVYEPFLLQRGFLKRTTQGRVVTPLAYTHLGVDLPKNLQAELF